jgi:hypothetical protein
MNCAAIGPDEARYGPTFPQPGEPDAGGHAQIGIGASAAQVS